MEMTQAEEEGHHSDCIVVTWKEHFVEFLNLTNTSPWERQSLKTRGSLTSIPGKRSSFVC